MRKYDKLSKETIEKIEWDRKNRVTNPFAFSDEKAIRRIDNPNDRSSILRSNFIRDVDKILNCPFYNRYADKTQVFSFYKNDDVTRRALHVQLVSRIARTIGKALNLNVELIEAIAFGHDLGHAPFGHAGERILDEIYFSKTNRHFYHNLQSVRVLDKIFPFNLTLQTLDGVAGHNGEIEKEIYTPSSITNFNHFDNAVEQAYTDGEKARTLSPSTLEGCLVRICDIIAYLGKDRQDGTKTNVYDENSFYSSVIGSINAEIVNNLSVNIIENSYGKNCIKLHPDYFNALSQAKKENYELLYNEARTKDIINGSIKPMMEKLYEKLYRDLISGDNSSPVYTHHINYVNSSYYDRETPYLETERNQIVVDYIASMTDQYFIEIFNHLFPNNQYKIEFKGYF